jgi:lipopolysaccharide cholinephosphotransferase
MTPAELRGELLAVLREIDRFCKMSGIEYCLYAGTLLGAVRHQGFIPWDDDADVLMSRADYERFCREYESSGRFVLFTRETHSSYPYASAKLSRSGTRVLEEVHMAAEDLFGVSVDLFPYDPVPDNRVLYGGLCLLNRWARALLLLKVVRAAPDRPLPVRLVLRLADALLRPLPVPLLTGLRGQVAKLFALTGGQDVSMVVSGPRLWRVPVAAIEPCRPLVFEGRTFSGPAEPEVLLSAHYGDYMTLPPVEERRPPHRAKSYWIEGPD